jgi:hypothetical protein
MISRKMDPESKNESKNEVRLDISPPFGQFYKPAHPTVEGYVQQFGGTGLSYLISYPFLSRQWRKGGHYYSWKERSPHHTNICRDRSGLVRGDGLVIDSRAKDWRTCCARNDQYTASIDPHTNHLVGVTNGMFKFE